MSEQIRGRAAAGDPTALPSDELPAPEERIVQELIGARLYASCELVPIDEQTWAIRGSIAYEGEVILAEFDNLRDARAALDELEAAGLTPPRSDPGTRPREDGQP